LPAVGHGEAEGLEGHFIEEVSYLLWREHTFQVSACLQKYNVHRKLEPCKTIALQP
jgi:hypothetical protein